MTATCSLNESLLCCCQSPSLQNLGTDKTSATSIFGPAVPQVMNETSTGSCGSVSQSQALCSTSLTNTISGGPIDLSWHFSSVGSLALVGLKASALSEHSPPLQLPPSSR